MQRKIISAFVDEYNRDKSKEYQVKEEDFGWFLGELYYHSPFYPLYIILKDISKAPKVLNKIYDYVQEINNYKFVIIQLTDNYLKEQNLEGAFKKCAAYIYDAEEGFLPDYMEGWLYLLMRQIALNHQNIDFQEQQQGSLFEIDQEFLNILKHHPQCVHFQTLNSEKDEYEIDDIVHNKLNHSFPQTDTL